MRRVLDFLFGDDDLPIALQVFWKLLTWSLGGVLFYAALFVDDTLGRVLLMLFSAFWVVFGLFTKLGDG